MQLRNDGAEGHGLVGDYQRGAELDCLQQITARLGPVLPSSKPDGQLVVGPDGKTVALQFLRLFDTKPALIRRIKVVGRNKLRVDVQFIHAEQGRRKARFETENYFSALNTASAPKLEQWSNSWSPLCYLPDRTTESFKGRKEEQVSLTEWMNDEESRTCLVFGDGGVGKTTLVLEFMHRLLEEDPDIQCEWKPKVVSFYTAKKWRWGLDGVELISAGQPHLLGLLAHLQVRSRHIGNSLVQGHG